MLTIAVCAEQNKSKTLTSAVVYNEVFSLIKSLAEHFGLQVSWDAEEREMTIGETESTDDSLYTLNENTVRTIVSYVIDGDTIVAPVNGQKERLRLIGIDAPEYYHKDPSQNTPEAIQVTQFVKEKLESQEVYLEFDVRERDDYGRLLAYVWLSDGTLFNSLLLKEGMARIYTYPPNVKYTLLLTLSQAEAQQNQKGLWAEESK